MKRVCLMALLAPGLLTGQHLRALIIANQQYSPSPLPNAVSAGRGMADFLKREAEFDDIRVLENATLNQMSAAARSFANGLARGDVAFVYYAGLAIEDSDTNWLLPVDYPATGGDPKLQALDMRAVIGSVQTGAKLRIVLLDVAEAFGKKLNRLSFQDAGETYVIVASKNPRDQDADITWFSRSFMRSLRRYGISLLRTIADARESFDAPGRGYSSYLAMAGDDRQELVIRSRSSNDAGTAHFGLGGVGNFPRRDFAESEWNDIKNSTSPEQLQRFEKEYPSSRFALEASAREKELTREAEFNAQQHQPALVRYPSIETPRSVKPGGQFSALVSLMMKRDAPQTVVEQAGKDVGRPEEGAVSFQAACKTSCELEVVIQAPDLEILPDGNNSATISMTESESSTPANFQLMVPADFKGSVTRITANFWYKGQFLARAFRTVRIGNPTFGLAGGGLAGLSAASAAAPPLPPVSLALEPAESATPDLVIRWEEAPQSKHKCQVEIASPVLGRVKTEDCTPAGELEDFLRQHYRLILAETRGVGRRVETSESASADSASAEMRGLGLQLNKFVPPLVRDAFWALVDREKTTAGYKFRRIEIQTNNPTFPWEIWIPQRESGAYPEFAGASFVMSRWHIDDTVRAAPPVRMPLARTAVVAPHYTGAAALPHTAEELAELRLMPGFREEEGTEIGFKSLLRDPEAGIVHFAGHGRAEMSGAVMIYGLRLEDAELDPGRWRAYAASQNGSHAVYFLNACETGQESVVGGSVEGWASAILDSGASGFIGGLWPLSDVGAAAFAREFYRNIRVGLAEHGRVRVAEAMLETRRKLLASGDPTIMSYVFYGDVGLEFFR